MRPFRTLVPLLLVALASACQGRSPVPIGALGPCPGLNEGPHRTTLVRAVHAEQALHASNRGGLAIRVTSARYQEFVALNEARITLAPLRASADGQSGTQGLSDSTGAWTSGALPPGPYAIDVRLIGYRSLRDSLTIRAAFRDTLEVQLRRDVLC